MRYLYLMIIFALVGGFYSLVPWARIHGVFNVRDIGIALVLLGVAVILLREKNLSIAANMYSSLLLALIFLLAIQAGLAAIYYQQSIVSGLIGLRAYAYYLCFFLFLFLLDDTAKIRRFFELVSYLAYALVFLSLVNYFSPNTVFHHKWAEGHGVRSGITRAYIPAMDLLTFSLIWQFSKWVEDPNGKRASGVAALLLYAAHVFRQSRGRLLSVTAVMAGILILKARVKILALVATTGLVAALTLDLFMEENILLNIFTSSAENVIEGSGTIDARSNMLQHDLEQFAKYPWIGGGTASLRVPESGGSATEELQEVAAVDDLGYSRWLKSFGAAGIFWLFAVFYFFFTRSRAAYRRAPARDRDIVLCVSSYFAHVVISMVTLNHLMLPSRVVFIGMCAAVLVRINWDYLVRRSPATGRTSRKSKLITQS